MVLRYALQKKWTESQRVLCSKRTTLGTDSHIELLSFPLFTPALDLYMISCPWNPWSIWIVDFWVRLAIGFTKGQVFSRQVGFSEHLRMESARYHHANPCSEVRRIDYDRCGHLRLRISDQTEPFLTCSVSHGHGNDHNMTISNQLLSNCLNLALSFNIQKCRIATTCGIPGEKNNNCYGCMRVNQRHEHFGRVVDEHTAIILQTSFSLPTVR